MNDRYKLGYMDALLTCLKWAIEMKQKDMIEKLKQQIKIEHGKVPY